jgi:hypothetical protein
VLIAQWVLTCFPRFYKLWLRRKRLYEKSEGGFMNSKASHQASLIAIVAGVTIAQENRVSNINSAVGSVRSINTAQKYYAEHHPERGYACDLATLGPPPSGEKESPDHAGLLTAALTDAESKAGYKFSLRCDDKSSPQRSYRVGAVPVSGKDTAVCSDQTAVIKVSEAGDAQRCRKNGRPL